MVDVDKVHVMRMGSALKRLLYVRMNQSRLRLIQNDFLVKLPTAMTISFEYAIDTEAHETEEYPHYKCS